MSASFLSAFYRFVFAKLFVSTFEIIKTLAQMFLMPKFNPTRTQYFQNQKKIALFLLFIFSFSSSFNSNIVRSSVCYFLESWCTHPIIIVSQVVRSSASQNILKMPSNHMIAGSNRKCVASDVSSPKNAIAC